MKIHSVFFLPAGAIDGFDGAAEKTTFHSQGKKLLKKIAEDVGLPAGQFKIDSNKGGPGICGEVGLYAEKLFVQLSEGGRVLFRSRKGMKDYCGGSNHWCNLTDFADDYDGDQHYLRFIENCKKLMAAA